MDVGTFHELLDAIGIRAGDHLFVHSSLDWIGGDVGAAATIIDALIERIGPTGTLCMPSYTWRGRLPGRPEDGSVVDLRRSATVVGLIPEVFRRWPGVRRSAHYWVPVCALGSHAEHFTSGQHTVLDPFGEGSTFRMFMQADGKAVGMGVSLNTSSLAHLPDHDLAALCPIQVMSSDPIEGTVIDRDGTELRTRTLVVRPEVMSAYRPGVLFDHHAGLRDRLLSETHNAASFFAYPVQAYHAAALEVGHAHLAAGRLPPWLGE